MGGCVHEIYLDEFKNLLRIWTWNLFGRKSYPKRIRVKFKGSAGPLWDLNSQLSNQYYRTISTELLEKVTSLQADTQLFIYCKVLLFARFYSGLLGSHPVIPFSWNQQCIISTPLHVYTITYLSSHKSEKYYTGYTGTQWLMLLQHKKQDWNNIQQMETDWS